MFIQRCICEEEILFDFRSYLKNDIYYLQGVLMTF
jgi:hypothetical protein